MSQVSFRKPVSFSQYHFLIVKLHGLWCFDAGTWDFQEIKQLEKEACELYGKDLVKLCSSPSDDDTVTNRIVKAYNHGKR